MKRIFSIAPKRLGGIDMLVPLYMEIRRIYPKTEINMIFIESQPYKDLCPLSHDCFSKAHSSS